MTEAWQSPEPDTTPQRHRCGWHGCLNHPTLVVVFGDQPAPARYACITCARRCERLAEYFKIELFVLPMHCWLS